MTTFRSNLDHLQVVMTIPLLCVGLFVFQLKSTSPLYCVAQLVAMVFSRTFSNKFNVLHHYQCVNI